MFLGYIKTTINDMTNTEWQACVKTYIFKTLNESLYCQYKTASTRVAQGQKYMYFEFFL